MARAECFARQTVVRRARQFAIDAHEGEKQRRRYTGEPYWVHPEAVARTVAGVGGDEEMVAAAWLHDVLEDTPVNVETLRQHFAERIVSLVVDLTSISCCSDSSRCHRKRIDRAHTARAHPDAKTIKLADVIDNISEIVDHDPDFARLYLVEKAMLLEHLREGDSYLFERARGLIEKGLRRLQITYPELPRQHRK